MKEKKETMYFVRMEQLYRELRKRPRMVSEFGKFVLYIAIGVYVHKRMYPQTRCPAKTENKTVLLGGKHPEEDIDDYLRKILELI